LQNPLQICISIELYRREPLSGFMSGTICASLNLYKERTKHFYKEFITMINKNINLMVILIFSLTMSFSVYAQLLSNDVSQFEVENKLEISPTTNISDQEEQIESLSPEEVALRNTVNQYADQVTKLEAENGAYNDDLVEELISLGQAYTNLGDHQNALDIYSRSLHINRVNQGLHNINQLPILDLIIKSNTALNNFDELVKNYSYMIWVNDRNYKMNDMRRVPAYIRAANWHMEAYDLTQPPSSLQHLIIATNFFSKAADIIETSKGPSDPELIQSLYGIVNANFELIEPYGFIPNIDSFISGKLYPLLPSNFKSDFDTDNSRNAYRALDYSPDHLSRIVQEEKYKFSLLQNSYRSGRNALIKIINIHENNPELPKLSYAYALTHMGDWYLRFYKRSFALFHYEQAYQVLLGIEYGDQAIHNLFGRPRSLGVFEEEPEFEFERYRVVSSKDLTEESGEQDYEFDAEELKDSKYVYVQFNITKYGAVRNLEILAANPEDNVRFRRMARNTINSTPFRPMIQDGQPIMTRDVKMLYRFQ
jgi:tetratricopeptide (TPR) repeat protein